PDADPVALRVAVEQADRDEVGHEALDGRGRQPGALADLGQGERGAGEREGVEDRGDLAQHEQVGLPAAVLLLHVLSPSVVRPYPAWWPGGGTGRSARPVPRAHAETSTTFITSGSIPAISSVT